MPAPPIPHPFQPSDSGCFEAEYCEAICRGEALTNQPDSCSPSTVGKCFAPTLHCQHKPNTKGTAGNTQAFRADLYPNISSELGMYDARQHPGLHCQFKRQCKKIWVTTRDLGFAWHPLPHG